MHDHGEAVEQRASCNVKARSMLRKVTAFDAFVAFKLNWYVTIHQIWTRDIT